MKCICTDWFLYFATVTANLFTFSLGCLVVWYSPVLPKLQSNDTSINPLGVPITTVEVSIGTSIIPVGSIIGTLFIGKFAEVFGRKSTMIYLACGTTLSFGAMYFIGHIYLYYLSFLAAVICISAGFVIAPIYVAEIAEDHNRGKLGCILTVFLITGELYGYVIGPMTSFGIFSLVCGLPTLLFLLLSIFIPESPIYLSLKEGKKESIKALQKLRRHKKLIEIEREYAEAERMVNSNLAEKVTDIRVFFKTRSGKKAIILSVGIRLTQQLSGLLLILSFLGPLFQEAGSQLSPENLTIILTLINIGVAFISVNMIEKTGRRFLLLTGTFFDGLSTFILGIYFVFKENNYVLSDTVKVLPVLCLLVFICMYTFGLSNVPIILINEILPNELRTTGNSLVLVTGNIGISIVAFGYPLACEYLGTYVPMFVFSFFCFAGFTFIYLLLPETKGKSFLEIQEMLEK